MSRKKCPLDEKTLGGRLRIFRGMNGYKLADFADLLSISHGSLSDMENNKTKPSSRPLDALIQNTEINIYWLYSGKGSPYKLNEFGDEILLYDNKDMPIAERTQDMRMDLEAITKEEAERRKKEAAKNKLLKMAGEVLDSNTDYSSSLMVIIKSLHGSIETEKKLNDQNRRLTLVEQKIKENEKKDQDNE